MSVPAFTITKGNAEVEIELQFNYTCVINTEVWDVEIYGTSTTFIW